MKEYPLVYGPLSNDVRHDKIHYYYCGNCKWTLRKVSEGRTNLNFCEKCGAKIDLKAEPIWFAEAWDWYNDPYYYI